MSTKASPIKLKYRVAAPAAQVYRAFTHSLALRDWLCDYAHVEPRVGGPLYFEWNSGYLVTGSYTSLVPNTRLALRWHGTGEPEPTRVQIVLADEGGQTLVKLTHSGLGAGKKWAAAREQIADGWRLGLENLVSVLETGIDLRFVRKPRLGIWYDFLTNEIADRLEIPFKEGVLLQGTVEGTGARAAGLQKDDVIVRMSGKKVNSPEAIGPVLQGRQAGDKVPVVVYRGPQRLRLEVELSRWPITQVPDTPAELVDSMRSAYVEMNQNLDQMLEGLTEEQADFHPAPDAWSIKEILAHLIACERDYQSWVADMVNDRDVREGLEARPNVNPRLHALVQRFGTLPALRTELDAAENETLDFIAGLPEEFVARKPMYRRAAVWAVEFIKGHLVDEHGDQIRATIQAARSANATGST